MFNFVLSSIGNRYIMDSEPEIERRYADLTMIIRPDKRYGKLFDVLIEFKFVPLKSVRIKDAQMTGEQAKHLTEEELNQLPQIVDSLEDGERQVSEYGKQLEDKYGNLRLQKFVVVSLGFERVCFKKIKKIHDSDKSMIQINP